MLDLDCPWCEGSLTLDDEAHEVSCEDCGVRVALAADPSIERMPLAA